VDHQEKQYTVAALNTLVSTIQGISKERGNRDVEDTEVYAVIRKFIKGIKECIAVATKGSEREHLYHREVALLEGYLPKQMTEKDIVDELNNFHKGLLNIPHLGAVMTHFKNTFPGQYDNVMLKDLATGFLDAKVQIKKGLDSGELVLS
jgi:uncharacterized protein YqeY